MKCQFCELKEIKQRKIAENAFAWCFPTHQPIVPGHVLICPLRCVSSMDDLTRQEIRALLDLRSKLKKAMIKIFNADGFNYAWNEGEVAGQTVPHLHLHMIPRKKGDKGINKYEPRKFLYRPGSREVSQQDELLKVAYSLKEEIK